jgi:hypothetical protein
MGNFNFEDGFKRIVIVLTFFITPVGLFLFSTGLYRDRKESTDLGIFSLVFVALLWVIFYAVIWIVKGFNNDDK